MAYTVKVMPLAESDLERIYAYIDAEHSAAAQKWYAGLKHALFTLDAHPNRCPKTPENKMLRHLLYGRKPHVYRIIFRVVEKKKRVEIVHIRHGARRAI